MKKFLALILAIFIMLCTFLSCSKNDDLLLDDDISQSKIDTEDENNGVDNAQSDNEDENSSGNNTQSDSKDENNIGNYTQITTEPDYAKFEHSETFYRAQKRFNGLWNDRPSYTGKSYFLYSPVSFKFLHERGVVYYNADGEPRVYGWDDDFSGTVSLMGRVYIDENTEDNDFYLLIQSINGKISRYNTVYQVALYTAMLKYTDLPDDLYRDLLLYATDYRAALLVQQIGEEYTPELLSESIVDYEYINTFCSDMTESYINDNDNSWVKATYFRYIENVDYENLTITFNYSPLDSRSSKDDEHIGKIYSYTYKLKETPGWESCLVYNSISGCISKEHRDSLTNEDIMQTYNINAGKVLYEAAAEGAVLRPSDEQKATAVLKYNLTYLFDKQHKFSGNGVDKYEIGELHYKEVNQFTRSYVKKLENSN